MNIFYSAAAVSEKDIAKEYVKYLEKRSGWVCNSTWYNKSELIQRPIDIAAACLSEIKQADVIILYSLSKTRGKWFEAGYALANDKPIIYYHEDHLSHPAFSYLPNFLWVKTTEQIIKYLEKYKCRSVKPSEKT